MLVGTKRRKRKRHTRGNVSNSSSVHWQSTPESFHESNIEPVPPKTTLTCQELEEQEIDVVADSPPVVEHETAPEAYEDVLGRDAPVVGEAVLDEHDGCMDDLLQGLCEEDVVGEFSVSALASGSMLEEPIDCSPYRLPPSSSSTPVRPPSSPPIAAPLSPDLSGCSVAAATVPSPPTCSHIPGFIPASVLHSRSGTVADYNYSGSRTSSGMVEYSNRGGRTSFGMVEYNNSGRTSAGTVDYNYSGRTSTGMVEYSSRASFGMVEYSSSGSRTGTVPYSSSGKGSSIGAGSGGVSSVGVGGESPTAASSHLSPRPGWMGGRRGDVRMDVGREGGGWGVAGRDERGSDPSGDSFYGLPSKVKDLFKELRGITQLYAWQHRCLNLPELRSGGNLIYSLPTSGGKTLVAEVLLLQQILLRRKDVLFILPFVSIVQEKVRQLSEFGEALGFAVEEYASSRGRIPPRRRRQGNTLFVATIEKGTGLVNSLISTGLMDTVGLVIVDELHMLGEEGRGAVLEACLCKVLCSSPRCHVVGMSATLSNLPQVATFLDAAVFTDTFRPVNLVEYCKVERTLYRVDYPSHSTSTSRSVDLPRARVLPQNPLLQAVDRDQVVSLVLEVLPGEACLVFCPSKKNCQSVALLLARHLPRDYLELKREEKRVLLKSLKLEASGLCPVLAECLPMGVAYHHSGLSSEERRLLEEAYSCGVVPVITCTSTLAAGVNLPARRVVVRSPYVGSQFLSKSQYKQMVGRAGRAGLSAAGESILIVPSKDRQQVMDMLTSGMDHCTSRLLGNGNRALTSLVLEGIALKLVYSRSTLLALVDRTLLSVQAPAADVHREALQSLDLLLARGYVKTRPDRTTSTTSTTSSGGTGSGRVDGGSGGGPGGGGSGSGGIGDVDGSVYGGVHDGDGDGGGVECRLEATSLGLAAFRGCLSLEVASHAYACALEAQRCLLLSSELHLLYLATPPDMVPHIQPNWMAYSDTFSKLSGEEQRVAELLGVRESVLCRKATGTGKKMAPEEALVYHKFFLSLMLRGLLQLQSSRGVWQVAEWFQCSRGFLQSLLHASSSYASCLVHFTKELPDLWAVHLLLPTLVKRLSFASSIEMVPLLEIPDMKHGRAVQLYAAGYRSPQDVAQASAQDLCAAVEHLFPNAARKMVRNAKALLAEQMADLEEEMEKLRIFNPANPVS